MLTGRREVLYLDNYQISKRYFYVGISLLLSTLSLKIPFIIIIIIYYYYYCYYYCYFIAPIQLHCISHLSFLRLPTNCIFLETREWE